MTPQEIGLVRASFAQLHRRRIETACLFYERLFTSAPDTRALFRNDIESQARNLMEMLTVALAMLNDPGGLNALLERLGERHRGYGVRREHYDAVRRTLLWTLETSLGESFTQQTREAWVSLYDQMVKAMLAGEPAEQPAAPATLFR